MKKIYVSVENYYTEDHRLAMDILLDGFSKEIELTSKTVTSHGTEYSLTVSETGLRLIKALNNADCLYFSEEEICIQ